MSIKNLQLLLSLWLRDRRFSAGWYSDTRKLKGYADHDNVLFGDQLSEFLEIKNKAHS